MRAPAFVAAALALTTAALAEPTTDYAAITPASAGTDLWREAETAAARGDCEAAAPLYRTVLDAGPSPARRIAATHALVLCTADPDEPWTARALMADLLPVVTAHFGAQSSGLARHHAIWAEAEVRAGALDVAWRRSEAAIAASRAAGNVDPFEHAAELYRLAAIQIARGEAGAFLAFLDTERARLDAADWMAEGDDALFDELMGRVPAAEETEALAAWARAGLEEFDPRPLYLTLLDRPV
ncbi:MAG: hypothetical protein ACFBWO_18480 [Paracoccaceae bacterium]